VINPMKRGNQKVSILIKKINNDAVVKSIPFFKSKPNIPPSVIIIPPGTNDNNPIIWLVK
jgi:hypothetical protein